MQNHVFASVVNILSSPTQVIEAATLQKFAKITPQYPGVRAPLPQSVSLAWLNELSPLLDTAFGSSEHGWEMQAWFSLVTAGPGDLIPMQRFPHVDGTDARQLAMMLYLHDTPHGGTGFFRQRSTGLEALTDANFPRYRQALENDVRTNGLPPPAYVTDGEPYFERTHVCEGAFNQAFFYRGNVLHSGLIDGSAELSPDPARGRLTINAFFRPIEQAQMGS
ncbi:hypothetical protein CD351_14255 [Erythrobacter sp. KY5]|uniref:DUF6445 family protein n=1 Tax=Erythrobacter sp. KY5 TaxID=2011159 RepID=UPI000DBF1C97|nr:DUF6445 family protein [Erythrobacter sp. KY5]AWW75596.1 hypothetical protein CD351_14255 [Erythrobacter sp. KY5]